MKKKLIAMLTMLCICMASLASAVMVMAADESSIISAEYSGGVTYVYAEEGGVFYGTEIAHAAMVGFNFKEGMTLNETEHTYVHMKGIVSDNVYRIKLNGIYLINMSDTARGAITIGEDGVFEYHAALTASGPEGQYFNYGDSDFDFQMYVNSGTATLNMLGVVFNNSETYDDFAEPYAPEGGGEEEPEVPVVPPVGGEVSFGAMAVVGEGATVEGNKATYAVAEETSIDSIEAGIYLSIPVTNWDFANDANVSIKYATSGVNGIGMHVVGANAGGELNTYVANILPAGWNVKTTAYASAGFSISTASMGNYLADFASASAIIIKVQADANATFELLEIAVHAGDDHGFELPAGPMEIGAMTSSTSALSVEKNADEEYVVSYSSAIGWHTANLAVTNYDASKSVFHVEFTASHNVILCFSINGQYEGHIEYPAGKKITIDTDVSTEAYALEDGKSYEIKIYFDAQVAEITDTKSIVFHTICFNEPEAAPEGLYLGAPVADAMTALKNEDGSVDLSWNNDSADWRNVTIAINNYELGYDILRVKLTATKNTNVNIRLYYQIPVDGEVLETYAVLRSHHTEEGVIPADGTYDFVYLAKAHGIENQILTKIVIYFDNPTPYTTNTGAQSAKIELIELLKSADITFEQLTITANDMTVDYNGEPVVFNASASAEVELKVEYGVAGAEGIEWTTSAPSKAGEYQVRITFMGSLQYDYAVATAKLTINKIKATVSDEDVVIDATTRVVTVAEGVIASTDEEFVEGFEVLTGDEIAYGTTIYFKRAADDNHEESEVMSITFNRPAQPDSSSTSTAPETSSSGANADLEKGCLSSVAGLGLQTLVLLAGAVVVFARKRK